MVIDLESEWKSCQEGFECMVGLISTMMTQGRQSKYCKIFGQKSIFIAHKKDKIKIGSSVIK